MTSEILTRMDAIRDLCRRHRVASLYAFGSWAAEALEWARNERDELAQRTSDLDLAVTPETDFAFSARERVRLSTDLKRLFNASRVDLVMLWEADAFLAVDVIRGELLYCADPDEQARDELYILGRAADAATLRRKSLVDIRGDLLDAGDDTRPHR